jgi:hypothetical protein
MFLTFKINSFFLPIEGPRRLETGEITISGRTCVKDGSTDYRAIGWIREPSNHDGEHIIQLQKLQ